MNTTRLLLVDDHQLILDRLQTLFVSMPGIEASGDRKLTDTFGAKPREVNPLTENFTFKFYSPGAARVTYDQYMFGKENNKPSKEIRIVEKVGGQWKIDGVIALWDYGQNKYEKDLVRKTLETETRAYNKANLELLTAQWAMEKPYIERQQANLKQVGAPFLKGDNLRALGESYFKTLKPSGQTARFTDYDVHIWGETAWATYTQEAVDNAGKVTGKQREIRHRPRTGPGWWCPRHAPSLHPDW